MKEWKPNADDKFATKQRQLIKKTLFRMFADNRVAVVTMKNGEIQPYEMWKYTLMMTGIE